MFDHYYAVIMAGGGGTRLWPLSRQAQPKQMLRFLEERSLFEISVERLEGIFPPDRILVVTVEDQAKILHEQCPSIPIENFLLEPMPRGTASVIGLAGIALKQRDPEAVMAVLTSDHFIGNEEGFRDILTTAFEVAVDGYLVTLGISPTYAATGYGYIQQGNLIRKYREHEVFRAIRFKEKPDTEQALAMLMSGNHSWNSGMFVWRVDKILGEIAQQMPDLSRKLDEIAFVWGTVNQDQVLEQLWKSIRPVTIDYGIMENAENVSVIPVENLQWNDVGSWDSLFAVMSRDTNGNIIMGGQHIGLETKNSLVYGSQENRLIVTIGLNDLVVVDTGDVLLICHKDQAQKVRQIVSQLEDDKLNYA